MYDTPPLTTKSHAMATGFVESRPTSGITMWPPNPYVSHYETRVLVCLLTATIKQLSYQRREVKRHNGCSRVTVRRIVGSSLR